MFKFLVWHVLIVAGTCELFKEESGYVVEYAPTYDNYKPRDYHFNYAVSDPHTGDHKSQWEVKTNGVVRGGYSLLEPDGTTRIVEYIADDGGFRAVVKKIGTAIHPEVVPQVAVVPEIPEAVHPLPEVAQPLQELSHYRAYDGQVANYASQVEVPSVGIQVPPILYRIEQTLGGGEGLVAQPQALGTVETSVGHDLSVPLDQSQEIRPVPLEINQQNIGDGGITQGHPVVHVPNLVNIARRTDVISGQGDILGETGVPLPQAVNVEGHTGAGLGSTESLRQAYNLGQIKVAPLPRQYLDRSYGAPLQGYGLGGVELGPILQGQGLGRLDAIPVQGQDLGRVDVGPAIQNQYITRSEVGLDGSSIQGYNLGQGQVNVALGKGGEAPLPREQNIVSQPIETNNFEGARLPQPQIQIYNSRLPQLDQGRTEEDAVSGIVPVSPSYTTNIEYGLGNENRLKKDIYHASYSEKVVKVVPSPRKDEKKNKKNFLIYYPDSESH